MVFSVGVSVGVGIGETCGALSFKAFGDSSAALPSVGPAVIVSVSLRVGATEYENGCSAV